GYWTTERKPSLIGAILGLGSRIMILTGMLLILKCHAIRQARSYGEGGHRGSGGGNVMTTIPPLKTLNLRLRANISALGIYAFGKCRRVYTAAYLSLPNQASYASRMPPDN